MTATAVSSPSRGAQATRSDPLVSVEDLQVRVAQDSISEYDLTHTKEKKC